MKLKLLYLILLIQVATYGQQQWRPLGPDDFNQISYENTESFSAALDGNDIPYMAFILIFGKSSTLSLKTAFTN